MEVGVGVLQRVGPVLDRHHRPDVRRGVVARHVAADDGREVPAGAGVHRHAEGDGHRQRPHRVAVTLLLEGHRQHRAMDPRHHVLGRHDRRGPAHRTSGVHPEHRFAVGCQGIGKPQFWHVDALEHVGGLADHDRIDLGDGGVGTGQRPVDGLAHQPGDGNVRPARRVLGLADPDDCTTLGHHSPSNTATRFCCRHGPLAQWATARSAEPSAIREATSANRARPAAICGFAASAPPLGLIATASAFRPRAWNQQQLLVRVRGVQFGHVEPIGIDAGTLAPAIAAERTRGHRGRVEPLVGDAVVDAADPRRAAGQ